MSTKPTNPAPDPSVVEMHLKGPGAATVALFDSKGNALLTKRLVLSGPANAEAKSRLPLSLQTRAGEVPVVPVLVHQTNHKQSVSFAGKDAGAATAERSRELKLSKAAVAKIEHAALLAAERGGEPRVMLSIGGKSAPKAR